MLKSTSFLGNRRILRAVLTVSAVVLLFAVSASAATEKVLYVFTGAADGGYPNGDLVSDAAGNWYGTNNAATISVVFKLSPNGSGGWVSTAIHIFQGGTDGEESLGGVILDSSGNLYGTTAVGGQKFGGGSGIVFELSPDGSGGWTEHILYSFLGGLDGDEPAGALILDAAGNLHGTTLGGGVDNAGTAFELSPMPDGSWTKRTIFNFGSYRGAAPFCSLIIDSVGNLYGTTEGTTAGTSVVFELMPSASGHWTERVLHTFGVGQDGAAAFGRLVFDKAGNLYGGTYGGGLYGYGTVFELMHAAPNNWKEKILHNFGIAAAGQGPTGNLIFDPTGNLYGLTFNGGVVGCVREGCGTAFELLPHSGSWSEKILTDFSVNVDGGFPYQGMTWDAAGNLYGVTGGESGTVAPYGAVFEIIP